MKKLSIISTLLLTGVMGATSAVAAQSNGLDVLNKQMELLNVCTASYLDQLEMHAKFKGGSCTGAVNFENGTGGRCAALIDTATGTSAVDANCVLTVKTLATGTTISPVLQGQTLVFTPYIDSLSTPTAYASGTKAANGIVSWKIAYTAASGANLLSLSFLGVSGVNMFGKQGTPLNMVTSA